MPRQIQQLSYNSFSGGLITEASPLTFPDGASIDESNFELTKQGTRTRRLGLDAISEGTTLSQTISTTTGVVTYLWEETSVTNRTYLVVGAGSNVLIYDVTEDAPGESLVYSTDVEARGSISFAAYAGKLFVASGSPFITIIRAIGEGLFSETLDRLKVRDVVGIPDYVDPAGFDELADLRSAERSYLRPTAAQMYYEGSIGKTTVTFTAGTKILDDYTTSEGSTVTRYRIVPRQEDANHMGYPFDSFTVSETDGATRLLEVIFKDQFFRTTIATNLASGQLTQRGGVSYAIPLTAGEYAAFVAGTKTLQLTEVSPDYHPHEYNLWNQGWGEKRMQSDSEQLQFPIVDFYELTETYPSNADQVSFALYADTSRSENRTSDRFWPDNLEANPPGSLTAPRGKFIIDALNRGETRATAFKEDLEDKGVTVVSSGGLLPGSGGTTISGVTEVALSSVQLNAETTINGATSIAEYAGRMWYAGFSEDSPGSTLPMANKVLFSQANDDNLLDCYQEADPTSVQDSAQVETDGGFVTISGLETVLRIVAVDTALLVFATNGVWVISGVDGNIFNPLSTRVAKVTDKGAVSAQSVVVVDRDVYYWAEDGAYRMSSGGYAEFALESITKNSINSFVTSLNAADMEGITGVYDERLERIVWIVDGRAGLTERRVLIYHMLFSAFTINTFPVVEYEVDNDGPQQFRYDILGLTETPLFTAEAVDANVLAGTSTVLAGADSVVFEGQDTIAKDSMVAYIAIEYNSETGVNLLFADTVRNDFKDWGQDDAPAFLLTGYVTGGDTSRQKQVPWLTVHCNKTETTADFVDAFNESSCLVQSQWEWTNDAYANKWSSPFQAYRLSRPQIRGIGEEVAQGIEVVTTKNKLRGRGKTVSLLFSTEEDKDCQILGWNMLVGVNNNV